MNLEEIIATLKIRWKSFVKLFILFSVIVTIGLALLSGYGYDATKQLGPETQYQSIIVFGSTIPDSYLDYRFRLTDIVQDLLKQCKQNDKSDDIYSYNLTGDTVSSTITIIAEDAATASQKTEEFADYIIESIGIPVVEISYISSEPYSIEVQTTTTAKVGIVELVAIGLFLGFISSFIIVMIINDMDHVLRTKYRIYRQNEMAGMKFFPIMGEKLTATAIALYQCIQRDIPTVFCGINNNESICDIVNHIADLFANDSNHLGIINLDAKNNFSANSNFVHVISMNCESVRDYSDKQFKSSLEKLQSICEKVIVLTPTLLAAPIAPLVAGHHALIYFVKLGETRLEHLNMAVQYLGQEQEKLNGWTIIQ